MKQTGKESPTKGTDKFPTGKKDSAAKPFGTKTSKLDDKADVKKVKASPEKTLPKRYGAKGNV